MTNMMGLLHDRALVSDIPCMIIVPSEYQPNRETQNLTRFHQYADLMNGPAAIIQTMRSPR